MEGWFTLFYAHSDFMTDVTDDRNTWPKQPELCFLFPSSGSGGEIKQETGLNSLQIEPSAGFKGVKHSESDFHQ